MGWLHKKIREHSNAANTRSFVYRLLNGLLYANKDFARFGFKENSKCSFCDEARQDLKHLMLECRCVLDFRETVEQTIIRQQVGQLASLEHLFGPDDKTHSFIMIEANRYIYSKNHAEEKLKIQEFKAYIRKTCELEECIAKENDKLSKHQKNGTPLRY